jgi:WD40 repeat protein/uncharacterized caspase-like protein
MNKSIFRQLVSLIFLAAIATQFAQSEVMGQAKRRISRPPTASSPPETLNNSPQLIVQLGHSGVINAAAFSPDGRLVVSGGDDPIAIVWEAATGRIIRRLVGHSSPVSAVAFSPDGRFILTGCGESVTSDETKAKPDNSARLWDAATGKEVRRFVGHTGRINVVEFSPDGRFVLTASEDGKAGLWNVATGKIIRIFVERDAPTAKVAAFSPDGRFVLTGGGDFDHTDYTLRLWDASTANVVQRFIGYENPVGALAFTPDGQFVLSGGEKPLTEGNGTADVRLWNLKTGKEVRRFKALSPIAVSRDGKLILTGGTALTAEAPATGPTLLELNTGKKVHEFYTSDRAEKPKPDPAVKSDANASRTNASEDDEAKYVGAIDSVAFSPDGRQVLVATNPLSSGGSGGFTTGSTYLTIYDVASRKDLRHLEGIAETVSQVAFSRDNQLIIAGNVLWNLATGQQIPLNPSPDEERRNLQIISLSSDGQLALTADSGDIAYWNGSYSSNDEENPTNSNEIRLWDLSSARQLARFPKAQGAWLSSDGRFVLTMENKEKPEPKPKTAADKQAESVLGEDELRARLWETKGGKELWHYDFGPKDHSNAGGSYHGATPANFEWTISPDSRYVVIEGKDATVILNAADGSIANKFEDVGGDIPLLAVSPDGRFFATHESVNLVNMRTGKTAWSSRDPVGTNFTAYYLAFSPNGRFLLVGGQQMREKGSIAVYKLRLLDVTTGTQVREFLGQSMSIYAFSPDSRFLLTVDTSANVVNMWNLATGERAQQFAGHLAGVSSVAFSADQKLVLTGSNDSTTRVWDISNGQQVCRLLSFTDGNWAAMAPDGRFETNNLEEIKGLHWLIPDDPFRPLPLEIFMRDYYEPHLLARLVKCNREKNCEREFTPVRDISKLNRVQPPVKISNVSTPDAEGYVNVTVDVSKGEGKYLVNGQETRRTTGVYDLRLFRDGQMVGSWPPEGAEKLLQRTAADLESNEKLIGDARFLKELTDWRGATEVKPNDKVTIQQNNEMLTLPPFRVKLPRGKDVAAIDFTAYAFNEDRIKSQTARWQWPDTVKSTLPRAQPMTPRAYVITIGINAYENSNWNLKYAANDARQIQRTLSEKLAQGKGYQEVVPISLISDYQTTNGQDVVSEKLATKANIHGILDLLAGKVIDPEILKSIRGADKLRKAGPDDLVIISFSSHGYADNQGNFYLVPYDVGPGSKREITADLLRHCISSEELSLWLRDVDAGEMVMIVDACHSAASVQGEGFKPGPMGSRGLGQLSYDKGIRILSSTQSDDVALETDFTQQGLLSYALTHDGIGTGEADFKPRDKVITLAEWLEYGVYRVPTLYVEIEKKYQTLALNEIKSIGVGPGGRTKLLIFSRDGTNSSLKKGANQQPSLFDFTRKKQQIVLTKTN